MMKLQIIKGQMSLGFNRPLTETEYLKLSKTYNSVGWYIVTKFVDGQTEHLTMERKYAVKL